MFKVNNVPILEDELSVLEKLRFELLQSDRDLLRHFKKSGNNIQFTCPIHNHGMERKPSCGITINDTETTKAGTVHCFTCGYTATLDEMISHCFGYNDGGNYGRKWLSSNFLNVSISHRKEIVLPLNRNKNTVKNKCEYVSEDELSSYRYIHDYMYKRKLTDEIIEKFDVGYDPKQQTLTFPVRDIRGNTLFIARRSVNTKYFHYPSGVDKPLYGVYELPENATEVIVCESIINCLTCWVYGKYAIALNGTGTFKQYEELKKLKCRKIICALDPDDAGYKGTERIKKYLNRYKIVTQYVIPKGKDINDLTKEEFNNLVEIF